MGHPLGAAGRGRRGGEGRPAYRGARRFIRALPPLIIVGGVLFDVTTPAPYTASPMLAAAPLVAAPFFSLLTTLLTGIAAVLASVGLYLFSDDVTRAPAVAETLTVFTVSVLALLINRVVRRSGERLASARVIAETAQKAVLPTPAERIGGLRCAARYEAAQADAFIGGDLFAVQDTRTGCGSWSGTYGARASTRSRRSPSSSGPSGRRPSRSGPWRAWRSGSNGRWTGRAPAGTASTPSRVHHRRPGRDPALRRQRHLRRLRTGRQPGAPVPAGAARGRQGRAGRSEPAGAALGMGDLASWPDRAEARPYPPGTTLLFYTDGLSEARNAQGVFYDPAERLAGRIFPGPEEVLDALVDDVRLHTGGGATDDMALLALSRPAAGQPERRRTMPVVPPGRPRH